MSRIHDNKDDYKKLLEILRTYSNEDIARVICYAKSNAREDIVDIIHEMNLNLAGLKTYNEE